MTAPKSITENTAINIGLVSGLVVAVFWGGNKIGRLENTVERVDVRQVEIATVASSLERVTTNHEARLTAAEKLLERRGDKVASK